MSTEVEMGKLNVSTQIDMFRVDPDNRATENPNSLMIETMISNGDLDSVPQDVKELAESLRASGNSNDTVIAVQPKNDDGFYQAIFGNRRILALKYLAAALGETVSVRYEIRTNLSSLDIARMQLSENFSRQDITPVQKAYEFSRLKRLKVEELQANSNLTDRKASAKAMEELPSIVGVASSTLAVYVAFENYSEALKSAVMADKIDIFAAALVNSKSTEETLEADLEAMWDIAVDNRFSKISQNAVKAFYTNQEKAKKVEEKIEQAPVELQVAIEEGTEDPDMVALAVIESESTGIPAEQILNQAKSDSESGKASEPAIKAASAKLKDREKVEMDPEQVQEKIAFAKAALPSIKLSAYDPQEQQIIQKRVASMLYAVSGQIGYSEHFTSTLIGLMEMIESDLPSVAVALENGYNAINDLPPASKKADDAAAKEAKLAAKEAKLAAKNDVKSTTTKSKAKKKPVVDEGEDF